MRMNRNQAKKTSLSSLLRALGTILSLGLVALLLWQNWDDFINSFNRLSLRVLVILVFLAFFSRFIVTLRWFILLRVVEPEIKLDQAFKLSFVGLFTTNFLPSTIGGDFVKLGCATQFGLDSAAVAGSLVIDRIVGMTTMATFLPIGILTISQGNGFSTILSASNTGVLLSKVLGKIKDYFLRVILALETWLKHPFQLFIAACLSFVHMACTFTMVFLILRDLNNPTSWWVSGGLWVLVYFITLLPISINGLGLQEASLSMAFTSFASISESNGLVLAVMIRVLFMIASLPGAFFLYKTLSGDKLFPGKFLEKKPRE